MEFILQIKQGGKCKMKINLERLAKFLVKAKTRTYASADSQEIKAERPLHKELEFEEGEFYYRDSYIGFFQAPGMEEVRFGKERKTIWTMAYSGGMLSAFSKDGEFAKETFNFLKKALSLVTEDMPFRGPEELNENSWKYINKVEGDINRFIGHEKIFYKEKEVFSQDYIGGIVIEKN